MKGKGSLIVTKDWEMSSEGRIFNQITMS